VWTSPPVRAAVEPITVRHFLGVPAGCRRVRVSVGLAEAKGTVEVHAVRCIRVLEPEYGCHPFAVPPPAALVQPPRIAERVCVCSATADERPLTQRLRECLGPANVIALDPSELNLKGPQTDALILTDAAPPPAVRDLPALLKLCDDRYVVISLAAFAKLSRGAAVMRRIEQPDDPIHARVLFGNHATRGFVLHDTFAYAWAGKTPGSYCQNQYRKTDKLTRFCKRHGLVMLLESLCDKDATSDHPIALCRQTRGGGLYVLDLDPIEASASTMGEPAVAMHLLLSILGRGPSRVGQYITPVRTEAALRDMVRELGVRFCGIRVHDAEVPSAEVTEQMVTVGGEDQMFGLPAAPRPVILVRSGLAGGDAESFYGAWVWLKQLIRPLPHACPYGRELSSRFRIAWVPSAAPWRSGDGWQRSGEQPRVETMIETEDGGLAALIDIVSRPVQGERVVMAREDTAYRHVVRWLPNLFATFSAPAPYTWTVPQGVPFADRSAYAWRTLSECVEVAAEPDAFREAVYDDALAAGATCIRLEVPGFDADFIAHSIPRTDLIATLLEQVIGLQFGLIAVNRTAAAIHFDGFPPVDPGQALIADRNHPTLRLQIPQAG
jgi:hypothetical protein